MSEEMGSSQKRKLDEIYSSAEEDSDISETEMEDYEEKVYEKLKNGKFTVKLSDVKFRCPFCLGKRKQDYEYKHLVPHAKGAGKKSSSLKKFREKAKHLALARYLEKDCAPVKGDPMEEEVEEGKTVVDVVGSSNVVVVEEKFVYPWKGVVVNTEREFKNGRYIAPSGNRIKDQLVRFNPLRVHSLWGAQGSTGKAIVEFTSDWSGFRSAMSFENEFNSTGHGKAHFGLDRCGVGGMYGWVAREHDYKSDGVVGNFLSRNGDLKTIKDIEDEDLRKNKQLVTNLVHLVDEKNKNLEQVQLQYNETSYSLKNLASQHDKLNKKYNEETLKMQQDQKDRLEKMSNEREELKSKMESQKEELKLQREEMEKFKAQSESDREKLIEEKRKNAMKNSKLEMAELEQSKSDNNILRIAEEQKRVKEARLRERIEEEKQLDAKDKLELEVELLTGRLKTLTHMAGDDADLELAKKVEDLTIDLKDKKEELEDLEAMNQTLIVKERQSNDELQEARKELINVLKETNDRAVIRVKRMGELNPKPFQDACKRKYHRDEADVKASLLCTYWQDEIKDSNWFPFVNVKVGENKYKTEINEKDEKLSRLRNDMGNEVFKAVANALLELNEYNGSGRYIVPELWNFKYVRRATLKEGIQRLTKSKKK